MPAQVKEKKYVVAFNPMVGTFDNKRCLNQNGVVFVIGSAARYGIKKYPPEGKEQEQKSTIEWEGYFFISLFALYSLETTFF